MDTAREFQHEQLAACDEQGRRFSFPVPRNAALSSGYFLGVVAVIENDGHQVLITRRAMQKSAGGCWECPGGMVKFQESSIDAVRRELREELGISVSPAACLFVKSLLRLHQKIALFHVRFNGNISGLILQNEEVTEARWASLNEIEEKLQTGQFIAGSVLTLNLLKEIQLWTLR